MCGIAGIIHHDGRAVDHGLIKMMCRSMVHRGPDDEGLYLDRHVGLGHRRLSIIDRSAGHQPMCNEDETVWIVFNGEIYNFQEIREELLAAGHRFKTHSDTEVILHLYEDLEEACVQRLRGMFAFAIWDRRNDTLMLARDRVGIKPLYYHANARSLAFGSEIKALLALGEIQPQVDLQALHDFMTFRYNVAPQTMFKDIVKLPPGHLLTVKNGRTALKPYWDLDFSKKLIMSEEDMIEELYRKLRDSTRSHLVGEVPLGVLLSGGLDSTIITGLVAEVAGKRVNSFSVGFAGDEGTDLDELPYARMAARHFQTDHHELAMTPKEYADGLGNYLWHMEEPLADPSAVPLYHLSKLARNHVTIVLSGEGSDELLGGYSFWEGYKGFERARWFRKLPGAVRNQLVRPLNDRCVKSMRLDRYLALADMPESHYLQMIPAHMTSIFSEDAKWHLYGGGVDRGRLAHSEDTVKDLYRKTTRFEFLDQMLYVYTKQWMPDDLLLKADKMTMAHSLELRVPFLDHHFVEFAASLPCGMKVRRMGRRQYTTKYILRKAFGARIPHEILHRKKLGFSVPNRKLFDAELRTMAWDVFHSRSFSQSGLFDVERVSGLFDQKVERAYQWWYVWPLLVFALWRDMFVCGTGPSSRAGS